MRLALAALWAGVASAEYSRVHIERLYEDEGTIITDGAEDVGCMSSVCSAEYTSNTVHELVLGPSADPCLSGSSDLSFLAGKVVMLPSYSLESENSNTCSLTTRMERAVSAGVAGVLIWEPEANRIPAMQRPPDASSICQQRAVPICTIDEEHGSELVAYLNGQLNGGIAVDATDYSATVDFENMIPYDRNVDVDRSTSWGLTEIEVLTPYSIKWHYPATHASYNPLVSAEAEAFDIVPVEIKDTCWQPYDTNPFTRADRCADCLSNPFTPPVDIAGKLAILPTAAVSTPPAYGQFRCLAWAYEWAYHVQQFGGAGLIFPSLYGFVHYTPYALPYEVTIPTYGSRGYWTESWYREAQADVVTVKLPETVNGSGSSYWVEDDDLGALPLALLDYVVDMPTVGNTSLVVNETLYAGQAMFSPLSYPAQTAPPVIAEVNPLCHDVSGDPTEDGFSASCDACLEAIDDGDFISDPASVTGKVAFLQMNDTFCLNNWEEAVGALASAGAVAVVVGNDNEHVYTMVDSETFTSSIPAFNIERDHFDWVENTLLTYAGGSHTVYVPEIVDGLAVDHVTETGGPELPLTDVTVVWPVSLADTYLVGQSSFNPPDYESQELQVEPVCFINGCNSGGSCHTCNMIDNPMLPSRYCSNSHRQRSHSDLAGKLILLKVETADCFKPVSNAVLFAQELGAAGVLFWSDATAVELRTFHSVDDDTGVTIPSFNIDEQTGRAMLDYLIANNNNEVVVRIPYSRDGEVGGGGTGGPVVVDPPSTCDADCCDADCDRGDEDDGESDVTKLVEGISGGAVAGIVISCVAASIAITFYGYRYIYMRQTVPYNQMTMGTQTRGDGFDTIVVASSGNQMHTPPAEVELQARPWISARRPSGAGRYSTVPATASATFEADYDASGFGPAGLGGTQDSST